MSSPTTDPLISASDARVAWHRLLQASSRVLREIDAALDETERLMVSEFDVLITLANAPDGHLRMSDLASATMLSSGGLTRLVERLERRGLVRRDVDPDDRRAFHASLTDAGRAKLGEARRPHDAVIQRLIGERLTKGEVAALSRILAKVLEGDA